MCRVPTIKRLLCRSMPTTRDVLRRSSTLSPGSSVRRIQRTLSSNSSGGGMGAGAMTAAEAACAERPENGAVSASDGMPSMGVLISTSSGRGVASCSETCRCMSGACGIDTDTQDTCWGTAHSLIRARPGPSVGSRHQLPEASGDECRRRRSRDSVHWRRMKATSSRTSCALRAARNASFSLSAACHCPMRSCTWSLFKTCGET